MAKVPYLTATLPQLVSFATAVQGLEIAHNIKEPALRAKLAESGFTGDEIEVPDELVLAAEKPLTAADVAGRKMVRILIGVQEGVPGGRDAVPVGVNGTVARIMRGVPVDVPAEYVEVLNNAQKTIYDFGPNGEPINPTLSHIYPFSILGAVA